MEIKRKKVLFHYCKLETAIEHILPDRQLRFNFLTNTNDPRENKSFLFGAYFGDKKYFSPSELVEINTKISDQVRSDCKVICFSSDGELDGYQLSQMWAHYGSGHKGVCIGIDYEEFVQENKRFIKRGWFKKIHYASPRMLTKKIVDKRYKTVNLDHYSDDEAFADYLENSFRVTHKNYLFFTKSIEWQREQEHRLIYLSDEPGFEYCSIKKSLWSVFLGVDFNKHHLPSILQAVGDKNIPVYKLSHSGEFLYCEENLNC